MSQHYGPSYFLKHSHVEFGAKQKTVQSMLNTTNYLEAEQPQLGDLPTIVANYSVPDLFAAVQKMYIIWTENEHATVAKR